MANKSVSRVRKHRATLKERGLRPIQLWVPDVRAEGFADECARQSLLISQDPSEHEVLSWGEAVADRTGWE